MSATQSSPSTTSVAEFPPFTRGAYVYDRFHAKKNYNIEARMVSHHLRCGSEQPAGGTPVIEFGAGTGMMTKELRALGHPVIATEPMAEMRREFHGRFKPTPNHIHQDVFAGDIFGSLIDATDRRMLELEGAVAHFTVVSYACMNPEQLRQAFKFVRSRLAKGAVFVFDVINYAAAASNLREHEIQNLGGRGDNGDHRAVRKWFDVATGIVTYSILYNVSGASWRETHYQRAWTPSEISDALRAAGFEGLVLMFDPEERDLSEGCGLTKYSWTIQVAARA